MTDDEARRALARLEAILSTDAPLAPAAVDAARRVGGWLEEAAEAGDHLEIGYRMIAAWGGLGPRTLALLLAALPRVVRWAEGDEAWDRAAAARPSAN